MADTPDANVASKFSLPAEKASAESRPYSFRELVVVLRRRPRVFLGTLAGLLLLCVLYCLIAPNQYEAAAKVALRTQAANSLNLEGAEAIAPASILSTPLQLETLVNMLRGEGLAWRVITQLRLYQSAGFSRGFAGRFPGFDPQRPGVEAQEYLLKAFAKRLKVRTLPRTFLIEVRFRSKDPGLAAVVANALVRGLMAQESEGWRDSTVQGSAWMEGQLKALTMQVEGEEKRLGEFERQHRFTTTEQTVPGGLPVETLHDATSLQVDEAGRLLAAASGERILRESLYREAQAGNPELVLASNPELQAEMGPGGAALAQQLRAHASEIGLELAELRAEHGPKFPRVIELELAQIDLESRIKTEDENLLEAFRKTWSAAAERERLLQGQLDARMAEGLKQNDAAMEYAVMREQVQSGRELCSRLRRRIDEAGMTAGAHPSSIQVVDWAREPFQPVSPDLPLYLAITLFAGVWVALAGALGMEAFAARRDLGGKAAVTGMLLLAVLGARAWGQAPTPNTSGLPSGVVKLPQDAPVSRTSNGKDTPAIWNSAAPTAQQGELGTKALGPAMALPIGVGDFLEVSEFHLPEFHQAVRVAADGTVLLPLVGQVKLLGLSEQAAARALEKAFLDGGMLLHPQVSVLVTNAAGQDVSVLGEVARPGVYPYTQHHRLLDLLSAASGLGPNAGRLVNVFHREDAKTAHPYVLDPSGMDAKADGKTEHNPELLPGDTVLVSRAGLVYVIGDVVRPGGFAVDPVQGLTVVQALSLAWGATSNAASGKAILIRDQAGGRTLTRLNLKRMIRGQDPDEPVRDRDILFVPDSASKELLNKSLEAAIQSAIGVSIYAGLVYSQRF